MFYYISRICKGEKMKKKGRIKGFFSDFKKFISRGNILDMAVGVIVGGAFSAIVTAFTNKIIMPLINALLSVITGGNGLEGAFTFLKKVWTVDGAGETVIDLTKSIYIDWGAFITAILNFLIIAFTLFMVLKIAMSTRGYLQNAQKARPTKAERKELKAQGVNMKDYKEVIAKTAELREANKPAPVPPKPTQEDLLASILEELRKQNEGKVEVAPVETEVTLATPKTEKSKRTKKTETK